MDDLPLPAGISSRFLDGINGLRMHLLEAGDPRAPCLLLLHGFPELAFSWRKVMLPLAEGGYHVVAPDQRGYGRTTGWNADYDGDLAPFRPFNIVRDAMGLLAALGHDGVEAVIGHDFGSPMAAWCALLRPDLFRRVVLMSAPFGGPPPLQEGAKPRPATPDIHAALAALPRPRKHYQWHYSTREANAEMLHAPQGLHAFLRAYYHAKSADWPDNRPFPLAAWTADELAKLPGYYVMDLSKGMAEQVAPDMPSPASIAANRWLPEAELAVYAAEYARTGFQGGFQWYRCGTSRRFEAEHQLMAGRRIAQPSLFIAGASDWGIRQVPGALERMQREACTDMRGCHLIEGAGHWVQQEQPECTVAHLLDFLSGSGTDSLHR
ncbi:alpha/beta hydrolase [Belnapia sp. F-4-1]|uniref:alpha/beta hydrolase n=1 Tax=Belnapia sp. F-4-1 TaxID=1545443 RepID=UPI0005BC8DC0|nr:alpha/beta fold hydrolase [Belnapia sp. F-4-1]